MSRLTSVTIKMTIQDLPDVTVLLNRTQANLIAEVLLDADTDHFGSRELSELQQYFSQLRAILPKALV